MEQAPNPPTPHPVKQFLVGFLGTIIFSLTAGFIGTSINTSPRIFLFILGVVAFVSSYIYIFMRKSSQNVQLTKVQLFPKWFICGLLTGGAFIFLMIYILGTLHHQGYF